MSQLAGIAELDKLSRMSGIPRAELDPLKIIPHVQLRETRRALAELLFQGDEQVFRRLAWIANRIPGRLLVWLARARFGPLITARVAGLMVARRAVRAARKLPADFLADVSIYLDPRYARDILSQLPSHQIVEIVQVLIQRSEYLTMGRFVDYLSDNTIKAVIDSVPEEEHLIRIAYYMESKNRLDHVMRMMPRERLRKAILLILKPEKNMMLQLMSLVFHTGYELQHELGELAAEQDESVLIAIVNATQTHKLWGDLLPVVALLTPATQAKVVNLPVLREDPAVLECILETAEEYGLWRTVLPLVPYMGEPMKEVVAKMAGRLSESALRGLADAALMGEHWVQLTDIVVRLPEPKKQKIATILSTYGEVDPALLTRLKILATEYGLEQYF